MKEKDIQMFLVEWLGKAKPDLEYFSIPNEATYRRRDLRRMGIQNGISDLVFWGMGNTPLAYVELKLKKGKLSRQQKDFQSVCKKRDVPYHIIKTDDPEEALVKLRELIKEWTCSRPS